MPNIGADASLPRALKVGLTRYYADEIVVAAVQISAPANILTVMMSLALFKLAQVAFVYAAAAIGQGASLVRGYYPSARRATTTTAGEGDSEIPTAGTRCPLSLPSCKVLMQSHPTGMSLHCLSQHAPISDDSQLSLSAGLMASMRRWRMQAQTLQPPKMICGRRTTLQQASSCHRTAAPARSCAAACAASRTSCPTPGALGAAW